MIAEKTNTAQQLIESISPKAGKVNFINDDSLTKALSYLENKGIPTNKHEDYKYCNVDAILKKEFKTITQSLSPIRSIDQFKLKNTITLVVANGNFSPELSDTIKVKGLIVTPFSSAEKNSTKNISSLADASNDAFIALNTAFSGNGFYLKVEKNVKVEQSVHVIYISSGESASVVNPRNFIELEENSELNIIEHQIVLGTGKIFTSLLSEKLLHAGSQLTGVAIQDEKENGYSVNTNQVKISAGCNYNYTTVTLSGQLVRNNHNVVLDASNCEAHLNGLFITNNTQLVDNHTLMDHQKPHCESNELYKGVINDKSTGVFNGKIYVRKDAQKTNAYQSSKNILMSDDGTINTKPQLEIYADDVKCSHGTSTGKIDTEALFYLKARGIGEANAKKLLLNAFAGEVIEKIANEEVIELINSKIDSTF
jgi:Fe-S cluster assembly protein SufD